MLLRPGTTLFQRQLQADEKRSDDRHVLHSSSSSYSSSNFLWGSEDEDENEDESDLY
ncbi:MAG: hypothetical protein ABSH15_00500 [Verrucomicrobiota bacterium]|jgi:hypothetical protein